MSDDDLSEELLALVDDGPSKKRSSKSSSKPSKRRKQMDDSDEGEPMDLESEDDSGPETLTVNPYPLEGIYKDERDRSRIMGLPELEREQILADRQAERHKLDEKRQLDAFFQTRQGGPAGDETAGVAKAAKRAHTSTGTSSTKTSKLEELKRKRVEKSERQSGKASSSRHRAASGSSDEHGSSGSSDEDDQVDRSKKKEQERVSLNDLLRIQMRRGDLEKQLKSAHFEDYVVGGYVRYSIGQDSVTKQRAYRVCEVTAVMPYKRYQFSDGESGPIYDDRKLELKHGAATRAFTMDMVSQADFTQGEFDRWYATMREDNCPLPTLAELAKKKASWKELDNRLATEDEIAAAIAKKKAARGKSTSEQMIELNRKKAAYTMSMKRQDWDAADRLKAIISGLEDELRVNTAIAPAAETDETAILAAKLNEKNRRAQLDAIKKDEEMRREARKAGVSLDNKFDASARVKTKLRVHDVHSTPGSSAPTSPLVKPTADTIIDVPDLSLSGAAKDKKRLEEQVALSVELDLGDF